MTILLFILIYLWLRRRKRILARRERFEADRFLGELKWLSGRSHLSHPNFRAKYKGFSTNDSDAAIAIRLANSDRGRTRSDNHLFHNKHWEEDE